MAEYVVQQGDCLSSIAARFGYASWRTLYDHPDNAPFREQRPDPNLICPGDVLVLPEKGTKEASNGTEQRHRFKVRGSLTRLCLRLIDQDDTPFRSVDYVLHIEGQAFSGTTDGEGRIEQVIPADAQVGRLEVTLEAEEWQETIIWDLAIGALDPVTQLTGVQARLNNLAIDSGPVDGIMGPLTRSAVRCFQHQYGLDVDGIPGPKTQAKLKEVYGG